MSVHIKIFLTGTFIFLMSVPFCFAQSITKNAGERHSATSGFHFQHTSISGLHLYDISDSLTTDSTVKKPAFRKFRMKKSPWLAVGLSAVLPGAGQFYNRSYWKVPIVLGLAGYLGYEFYANDKKYRDYRDRYAASQTTEIPGGDPNLKFYREFYFNQRNDFVWYFTIVYVINLIDAYIDAHLFDFTVTEDKIERFGASDREYKLNMKLNF